MSITSSTPAGSAPSNAPRELRELLDQMSLREKIGQMTQVELGSIDADAIAEWSIGSVLSGGGGNPGDGSAAAWRANVESFVAASRRSRLGVPILYGTDAVHGHNNVRGATIFPHHIGLGATRDPDLVRAVARASALETGATGARWSFAPCLAVPMDVRWGRTYEGFSQDPALVAELGAAAIEGWHGDDPVRDGVLACAKHFVGEGAMVWGSAGNARHEWVDWWSGWGEGWQIDQGDVVLSEDELRRDHLRPFVAALAAGVRTVMACYCSWHGERLHGHRYLLTDVLKGELGFDGFVVSDWMAVDQLDADLPTAIEMSINAGVDMVMVPFDYQRFIETTNELVDAGRISPERIDDAVLRILGVKHELGLLEGDATPPPLSVMGCDDHRALARRAVAASVVSIDDSSATLPLAANSSVIAAGQAIDDIGIACGGWTVSWEGGEGDITDGTTMLGGLRRVVGADRVHHDPTGDATDVRADVGIVTVHEPPYVEGGGDRGDLRVPDDQLDVVRRVRGRVDRLVVVVVSGRPLLIEPIVEIADAVVACWLPGSEADGVVDALFGETVPTGALPVRWPRAIAAVPPIDTDSAESGEPGDGPPAWPIGHSASRNGR